MSAEYSISFPVTGWMTALACCRCDQLFFFEGDGYVGGVHCTEVVVRQAAG
jgi:hypothetical protein